MAKDKEATVRQQEGHNHSKIISHTRWEVTHKLKNNNTNKFSHCCEGSDPKSGFLTWESPGNLTLKASKDFHRTGGNKASSLGRSKQNLTCTKTHRKGAVTSQETEPKPPASVEGSPVETQAAGAHHRDEGLTAGVLEGPTGPSRLVHRDYCSVMSDSLQLHGL